MTFAHTPVLAEPALNWLDPKPGGRYVDGTVGGGGHAQLILEHEATASLLCIDRDAAAITAAGRHLAKYGSRAIFRRGSFAEMDVFAQEVGWDSVDGVLLDLGVSSHQLDTADRGFSFRKDGPLDMRMDRRQRTTAATILNTCSESELARIFREYGEERQAGKVARAVVTQRQDRAFSHTQQFAALLERVLVRKPGRRLPPPTRCFQALRIAVNEELTEVSEGLDRAIQLLASGGRIVVISFHSLEDRIVKNSFRDAARTCVCPPDLPVCRCNQKQTLRVLTRKPIRPTNSEIDANRRSAPARLRAAEKL